MRRFLVHGVAAVCSFCSVFAVMAEPAAADTVNTWVKARIGSESGVGAERPALAELEIATTDGGALVVTITVTGSSFRVNSPNVA
jgi:hypothetical protein